MLKIINVVKSKIDGVERMNKKQHIDLVNMVLKTDMPKHRWCEKNQVTTHIRNFKGGSFDCWKCDYHISNLGICDPI